MVRSLFASAVLSVLLLGASGCASFRGAMRDMKNTSLMGEAAPALDEGTWITPAHSVAAESPRARWKLVAFFLPG
jgi:hypothetical protein